MLTSCIVYGHFFSQQIFSLYQQTLQKSHIIPIIFAGYMLMFFVFGYYCSSPFCFEVVVFEKSKVVAKVELIHNSFVRFLNAQGSEYKPIQVPIHIVQTFFVGPVNVVKSAVT